MKKEQQKIGQFFKHLDDMIALEQRKIDKTKALKSAYLAEMFPVEGERTPKRRFSGFTDEWRLCSLGDLTKINTGDSDLQIQYQMESTHFLLDLKIFKEVTDIHLMEK